MIIVYCEHCGHRIDPEDLDSGAAARIDETTAYCPSCAATRPKTAGRGSSRRGLTPALPAAVAGPGASGRHPTPNAASGSGRQPTPKGSGTRLPAVTGTARESATRLPIVAPAPRESASGRLPSQKPETQSHTTLILSAAGVAGILLIVGVALASSSGTRNKPRKTSRSPVPDTRASEPTTVPHGTSEHTPPPHQFPPATPASPNTSPPATADIPLILRPDPVLSGDDLAASAARRLDEAKDFALRFPDEPYRLLQKFSDIANGYRSTPAGKEAAELVRQLKLPGLPPEEQWRDAVQLLPLLDPAQDSVCGSWTLEKGELSCQRDALLRIQTTCCPPAEYDVRLSFTRSSGQESVALHLPHAGSAVLLHLGSANDSLAAFATVAHKPSSDNATTVRRAAMLGKTRHTVLVQVRANYMRAFLDGEFLTQWSASDGVLNVAGVWKLNNPKLLGLVAHFSATTFHSLQLVAVSGQPTFTRQPTVAQKTSVPQLPADKVSASARQLYANAFAEFATRLHRLDPARTTQLSALLNDPRFEGLQAVIQRDIELCKNLALVRSWAQEALTALIRSKASCTLKTVDGKEHQVGKDKLLREFKDGNLIFEQSIGEAKIQSKLSYDALSFRTEFELASTAMPALPKNEILLLFAGLLTQYQPEPPIAALGVRRRLEAARKAGADSEQVSHVLAHLDFIDKEQQAENALAKIEQLARDKKLDEGLKALGAFAREFAHTRTQLAQQNRCAELQKIFDPVEPGLWASYFSGDTNDCFKTFHLSRPEKHFDFNWVENGPDEKVAKDYFGVLLHGRVRIDKPGQYKFSLDANHNATLWIDGAQLLLANWDATPKTAEVELTPGDHELKVRYYEHLQKAFLRLKLFQGTTELAAPFCYDPTKTQLYDKDK